MADTYQFDDLKRALPNGGHPGCEACEELVADAVDGILSPADQTFFDRHVAGCVACMERYASAQRGAAWLDLLKTQRPEPSAALLERILQQTAAQSALQVAADAQALPANVIPFLPRPVSRFTRWTRLALEPRLAMTAAMAFFSIALTMNLTGVRLDQLHAADLKPQNLRRTYYEANASALRYYDNLRVVRVLESRVDDLRQSNEDERPAKPAQQPKPEQKQKPAETIPEGSSRREAPMPGSVNPLQSGFNLAGPRGAQLPAARPALFKPVFLKRKGGLA